VSGLATSHATASSGRALDILVVDDDLAQLRLLQYLLKDLQLPHRLHYASDGKKALNFLHRQPPSEDAPRPDLILLDQNMPGMRGSEVLREIKTNAEISTIPVIVFSQSISPEDIAACYAERANAYIGKPADYEETRKLIAELDRFWTRIAKLPKV
jgi:two-component system, chemotaxis family, response regulator Rcp1